MSIWSYVNTNVSKFINPFYERFEEKLEINSDNILLHFWKEYFLQWTDYSKPLDIEDCFLQPDPRTDMISKLLEENKKLKKQLQEYRGDSKHVTLNSNGHS